MGRLKNIAKSWQRLALPSGGWGVLLLTAFLLLAGMRYASAQNNSVNPYINSTQKYRVPMGNYNNTVKWHIKNPSFNGGSEYELTDPLSWIVVGKFARTTPQRDSAFVDVTFDPAIFENSGTIIAGPWQLLYSEYNGDNCVARRMVEFSPVINQFNLSVFEYGPDCNSYTGLVWTNNDDITLSDTMTVVLSVVMHKATDHGVREWSCSGTVSLSAGYIIPADPLVFIPTAKRSGTSTNGGNFLISGVSGAGLTLTVTGLNPTSTLGDRVNFEVQVIGPPITDSNVKLTISNGQGVSGTDFRVLTNENSNTDNEQTRLLFGIPNMSIVADSP